MTYQATEQFLQDSIPHTRRTTEPKPRRRRALPEPERVSDTDLLDALQASNAAGEPADLAGLRQSVLNELSRRLNDDELVQEIPGTGLIQLAKELVKMPDEKPAGDDGEVSILDRIDALPPEHASEILRREIGRLDEQRAAMFAALERITETA